MTTEQLIQVLREQGYTLDLVSTIIGARAKYSARFFHASEEVCDECDGNIPNEWDDFSHAETMEEAVLAATHELTTRCPDILVNMGEPPLGLENKPVNLEDYE